VDDFEVAGRIDDQSGDLADVASASIRRCILNDGVADFEEFLRNTHSLVFLETHEKAREKRGANDLKFLSLWVTKLHALCKIGLLTHARVVVLKRKKRECQTLSVAGLSNLRPEQVSKFVDGLIGSDRVVLGEDTLDVVETIADSDILNNVTGMEDVSTSRWNLDLDRSSRCIGTLTH